MPLVGTVCPVRAWDCTDRDTSIAWVEFEHFRHAMLVVLVVHCKYDSLVPDHAEFDTQ